MTYEQKEEIYENYNPQRICLQSPSPTPKDSNRSSKQQQSPPRQYPPLHGPSYNHIQQRKESAKNITNSSQQQDFQFDLFDDVNSQNQNDLQTQAHNQGKQSNHFEILQEIYEDGSIYDGQKQNGKRHGEGKFFYVDGGYYEGEWKTGKMCGIGSLYYPSGGLAYLGQWSDDKFNGQGTVYNEQPMQLFSDFDYTLFDNLCEYWTKYQGDFVDDNKEGTGTLFLSNGDRFTGCFSQDLVHGQGTYFKKNGDIISGVWHQNKMEHKFQNI